MSRATIYGQLPTIHQCNFYSVPPICGVYISGSFATLQVLHRIAVQSECGLYTALVPRCVYRFEVPHAFCAVLTAAFYSPIPYTSPFPSKYKISFLCLHSIASIPKIKFRMMAPLAFICTFASHL